MIRNDGSQITRCIMSGSITFENILPIRVLKWLVILVGCKMKGINELEARECKILKCFFIFYKREICSNQNIIRLKKVSGCYTNPMLQPFC